MKGICSVCSANAIVLCAAMEQAARDGAPVLIEATANQVNQFGGYTGMQPSDFVNFVYGIADSRGFPRDRVILGGDHLGPLVWQNKPEAEAMPLAEELVSSFVSAGFTKIHLDTSMRLADDDPGLPLSDVTIARRGAALCAYAEKTFAGLGGASPPFYVIGSEVPTPGGPRDEADEARPTSPGDFSASYETFREIFSESGLAGAFDRVVAFVVQPGVEFTGDSVFDYDRSAARELFAALRNLGANIAFECHSTDYQTRKALRELVEDGAIILKVGPALTYALRQGAMALEMIESEMIRGTSLAPSGWADALDLAMTKNDAYWKNYYRGDENSQRLQRRHSFFDRARYYLPCPEVEAATRVLISNLNRTGIPLPLISQYTPRSFDRVRRGETEPRAENLLRDSVRNCLEDYSFAVKP